MNRISQRPAWVEVDLDAVASNVEAMALATAPARLCAVVKGDAYGHGAVPVARVALDSGADWLAVAMVDEGRTLREAGIDAPVLLLSEPGPAELADVVELDLRTTVYSLEVIDSLAAAVARKGGNPALVHLKVDTGMHRVGAAASELSALARAIQERPALRLEGVWTHCAVADQPDHPFTRDQADRFEAALSELSTAGVEASMVHAANSAAAIDHPRLRHDMARCGITVYGLAPSLAQADRLPLRPALSLKAQVSHTQRLAAGEAVSYGLRRPVSVPTVVATVPLGYADGVPRRWAEVGGEVLIRGERRPLAGTVTMDQLMIDCGQDGVERGEEVVLIGRQGGEELTAWDWAERLGTIAYEITTALSGRLPRRYVRSSL